MKSSASRAREVPFAPDRGRPHITDMTDKPKRPRDANQLAKFVVDVATGEIEDIQPEQHRQQREAGSLGGATRAAKLTPKERSSIARKAAEARWATKPAPSEEG